MRGTFVGWARAATRVVILAAIAILACPCAAQVGAGSEKGHIWLVLPDADSGGAVLAHAPPRSAAASNGEAGSDEGVLRVARRLTFLPVGAGAAEDTVMLVAGPRLPVDESADPVRGPSALSLRAAPTPMSDFWSYVPSGRFLPEAPLPDGLEVVGVSSGAGSPVVLGRLAGSWWLAALRGGVWEPIALPPDASREPRLVLTGSTGTGLGLVAPGSGSVWRAWELAIGDDSQSDPPTGRTLNAAAPLNDGEVFRVGSRWIVVRTVPGGLEIGAIDVGAERLVARIDHTPSDAVVGVNGVGGGRLIAVWTNPARSGESGDGEVELVEVSLGTGDTLYRGAPVHVSPISAAQFRILAASLVGLAVIALLIVLGPGETPIVLPEGASLAEPPRRLLATVVDVMIAVGVASVVFRVPVFDLLTLRVIFAGDGSWMALPATLGIGLAAGTLLEWLIGCTLGKAATGSRVVSVRPADAERAAGEGRSAARVHLWQALVRNVIKWVLPPVAALALLDPSGRHRGDVLSHSAVVIPTPPEPDDS